jgi:uncharacterized protein YecE (DUF72 family)
MSTSPVYPAGGRISTGHVSLGTSGWSYQEWVGVFYPSASESKLGYYTRIFPTAEVDSTFYAFPTAGTVKGWDRYSPKTFTFNAKIPQIITHEKLADLGPSIEVELDRFAELMQPLNNSGKLGCLLIQLPPSYRFDPVHLERFLSILPHGYKYAIEFRHKSWLQAATWKTLAKYNVANTIVDEPLLPPDVKVTADFAYLRWHGRGHRPWYDYHYSEQELEEWVPKVQEAQGSVKKLYGYFNNHFHGYAVENCLRIMQMMGELSSEQEEALTRAQTHLGKVAPSGFGLGKWINEDDSRTRLIDLLTELMGESRLARAMGIPEGDVSISVAGPDRIEAKIRTYSLIMAKESRSIDHDCGDWERAVETRQLCKHVGKVLLMIPSDLATDWADQIHEDIEKWKFRVLGKPG